MEINAGIIDNLNSIFATSNVSSEYEIKLNTVAIRDALNKIFPDKACVDVLFTRNTDKLFFGVSINPTITSADILNILFSDDDVVLDRYILEIDSKMFDVGLLPSEITAYILYEISSLMSSQAPVWEVRAIIDQYIASKDDVISIKESSNYSQLLIFAIKDALTKVSSIKYKDADGVCANKFINDSDIIDNLVNALGKIRSSVFGTGTDVKEPDLVLIAWAFDIYKDAKLKANCAIDTLERAIHFTGSKLQVAEIEKTIKSLQRIDIDIANESARVLNEAKNSGSLFANLKRNGLRAIEDDLYEYRLRVKNAETEDDAYYALRQINTRINLLQEYLYNTRDLPECEIERWRDVIDRYRNLREELSKKKIGARRQYNLFMDYDKLDILDR